MKKAKRWGKILMAALLLVFAAGPLLFCAVLRLGWPPVIGNLTAARAMRAYAAEAHPEWEAKSAWAGYNLVNDDYYLDFTYGTLYYERDNGLWLVRDEYREDALRSELGIGWRLKEGGEPSGYVRWSAGWRPRAPETPYITLRVDFSSKPGDPVPTEEEMRELMADRLMEIYSRVAPAAAVDRASVGYSHHAVDRENGGIQWNIITMDLPEGEALTREQILGAPIKVS